MEASGANRPSPWLRRLDLIKSISFRTIADEINARRLRGFNVRLLDPKQAKEIPRLAKRAATEGGVLKSLPPDLRASGPRMQRVLLALHSKIGANPSWVVRKALIAREMGLSDDATAERGIRDLEESDIIHVTRREREPRTGGQGPSEYRIIWATVKDLALNQGAQPSLFIERDLAAASSGRPDKSSGRGPRSREAPPHSAEAPPHYAGAGPHYAEAPPHNAGALIVDPRARVSPFHSPIHPSSSCPPERSEEEGDWSRIRDRLRAYGLGSHRQTAREARDGGWTAAQVDALLDRCEQHTIVAGKVRIQAWPAGAVWWQLRNASPGALITMQHSETYRRAKRDQDLKAEQERERKAHAERAAELAPINEALLVLSLEQVRELVDRLPKEMRPHAVADLREGRDPRERVLLRTALLALLEKGAPVR
ncbi:hypothetical protein Pan44_26480 [Caulifigura coniformis]|uniref:Uncharacterized protein n=1 Tax=Caulifigura coniformis TaxID=2527983 RepID=A0A517SEQ1_9PLAN|nr:hypothetical protein [Caulifigura coniformis]QDT54613.1 hypothetical protein Pan44_26480 [Caulifigura coniformis]